MKAVCIRSDGNLEQGKAYVVNGFKYAFGARCVLLVGVSGLYDAAFNCLDLTWNEVGE